MFTRQAHQATQVRLYCVLEVGFLHEIAMDIAKRDIMAKRLTACLRVVPVR